MATSTPSAPDAVHGIKRRGRPRKYANDAERQAAYRARQKEKGMVERRRSTWMAQASAEGQPARSEILVLDIGVGAIEKALRSRES